MRLRLIAPADLSPEQRPVYEDMRTGIEKNFQGFSTIAKGFAPHRAVESVAARAEVRESRFGS